MTLSTFQQFAQEGITGVEVNVSWSSIEPTLGSFNFSELNTYLHYAQETHLQLIPIFWEYISWYPNRPSWLPGGDEQTSLGGPAAEPAFWSHRAFDDYATFMQKTLEDAEQSPAFGGGFIDYGWNDAGFGPPPQGPEDIAGYAPQDIAEFHVWLRQQYRTIANFDTANETTYASWSQVPAYTPGSTHFAIYERFRLWSYRDLLGQLLHIARKTTQKPLYIYWGGGIGGASALGNLPDNVFALARRYHAVVDLDDSQHTALAALFGSLSQSYHVPLLEEMSPDASWASQEAEWLGHYPLEGGDRYGEDYFIYAGTPNDTYLAATWPQYLAWHSALAKVQGKLPQDTVGIMLGYDQLYSSATVGLAGGTQLLSDYLNSDRPAADVFSDLSVIDGAVSLKQFHTIIDWNGDLTAPNLNPKLKKALQQFEQTGGTIIPGPIQANANAFTLLDQPDGKYSVQTVLGRQAIVSKLGVSGHVAYTQYLYFKVPPTIVPPTEPNVTVTVTYANNQSNDFFLNYDSSDTAAPVGGAYDSAYPVDTTVPVSVTDSGAYATATFDLTNAQFKGAENGGSDFRIVVKYPGLAVSSVTVSAVGQSATFTPNELSMPSVPAQFSLAPNDIELEASASVDHESAYIVLSNTGTSSYTGTLTVPSKILQTWFPKTKRNEAPMISSRVLLGNITPTSSVYGPSWQVSVPPSGIAILAVHE